MAPGRQIAFLYILCAVSRRADATPTVAFPFNSQVPTVARVGEKYTYQFSASTFAPEDTNFTYSLSNQPQWLSVDSATRTLSGAPSQADAGASSFTLTAADDTGAAHMPCTLVVSTNPPPQIDWDIGQQLAQSANLSSTQPPVVTVLPSHDFKFDFRQDSFIDIVQRKLTYYATLADHTPLPAWLLFDDKQLVFSGTAPQLSSFPQSWDVDLIASDVQGFAGASATFTIAVATQKLVFVPQEFEVNITDGMHVDFTALQDAICLNGHRVSAQSLKSVKASPPAWLSLDKSSLALVGTVPDGALSESFTITATDNMGNEAIAVVRLVDGHDSLFTAQIGALTARPGQLFQYTFPNSLFSNRNIQLMVTLPETARWLSFDPSTRTLSGKVPETPSISKIEGTITAKISGSTTKESEDFTIDIATSIVSSSSRVSHASSSSTSSASGPADTSLERKDHSELSKGAIVAIVIAPLIFLTLLAALLLFCWRRRRRHEGYVDASSPAKRTISRPILPSEADIITVTTEVQTDIEKQAGFIPQGRESRKIMHAPQLSLGLPKHTSSRKSKKSMRFSNMSHASSIGNAEDTIRTDSNIPEWGRESAALQTPHDSFSVPTAIARSSRQLSDLSPSKRALRRLREKQDSRQSVGLGIDIDGGGVFPRHSSRGARGHRKAFSSLGHSTIQDGSSVTSFSTRGTSVLSTRPSDFPRPPTRSTFSGIRSVPALSLTDAEKRRSIRLIGRSDSIQDERSLQEKRQSFIRNRASTTLDSPLFAHGSRAMLGKKSNGNSSANVSSNSSQRRSRLGRSIATTYSESSSLEPPLRDSRRLSTKFRSAFAPNFPRAITRSTLDGTTEKQESDSWSTFYSDSGEDLAAQLALPRHERNFVVPGEASPTPPPAPPTSAQASSTRSFTPAGERGKPRQKWKERLREHSSSPLSTAVAVPVSEGNSPQLSAQTVAAKKNRLSEPLALVSNDSLSRGKLERPRLVQTKSNRPVSVERVQRLSSLKAETADTRPGSEMWEAMEGAGLMPPNSSEARSGTQRSNMSGPAFLKFGKHIQKRQLEIPEYAASFVDYKALKKLIKRLSTTPVIEAQRPTLEDEPLQESQASLQANKATFFFRLERELEKVNTFYLQKEDELKLRLRTLLDRKRGLQSRAAPASKLSSTYLALDEGFRLFSNDLDKLQQFVEVNQTAFSKILKKWDKTSKSRTKELYLSRAVDVQPCFNRDVISDLSDQATSGLLDLQAWAEGEKMDYTPAVELAQRSPMPGQDDEIEAQVVQAINVGNVSLVKDWVSRAGSKEEQRERTSRIFLNTVSTAPESAQDFLFASSLVNFNYSDPINERNCMHEAAISGKLNVLKLATTNQANVEAPDVYGRIPLHYACMHGRLEMIKPLILAAPSSRNAKDLDNFTPLIHAIVHSRTEAVKLILQADVAVNRLGNADHIPLNLACQYGSPEIIQQLLLYKPDLLPDAEGLYPQHLLARFAGSSKSLQILKDYGVDMNQQDNLYGWTAIFHAASEGYLQCLETLLQFGAKPDVKDEKGLSAMYYAAWEGHLHCMQRLAHEESRSNSRSLGQQAVPLGSSIPPPLLGSTGPPPNIDPEVIPDLSLPPPIIPLRRYGHSFLDTTKTFILLSFQDLESGAIEFYEDNRYPAARLTISSKSSDLIPRNIPLPVQDDFKNISFQIENLESFSIDFDIFPTFGSKVIARSAASSRVFTGKASSSGTWHLELFDPRLRAIGRINFRYQVVTPFHGIPLEITHFATYWKATSQDDSHPSNLITGSSLSGDFMRLFIQVTRDGVPVLYNSWALPASKNDLVGRMTYDEFQAAGLDAGRGRGVVQGLVGAGIDRSDLAAAQKQIARSYASLADALELLPSDLHLEIHVCYPTRQEEEALNLGPSLNINHVADSILRVVFEHARHLRESKENALRNFVFSSYNADVCTALNWKQPNYPVLLCNELGVAPTSDGDRNSNPNMVGSCGRTDMSIKESVRIAQSNNFMGLLCSSRLLDLVPALIPAVKEAGLVLISDYSHDVRDRPPSVLNLPQGVDGLLLENAVLRFKDTIDQ